MQFLLFLFIFSYIVCQIVKFVSTLTPLIQNVQHDTSMLLGKESEVPFNILFTCKYNSCLIILRE